MHPAFKTYKLNEVGVAKAAKMAEAFDRFLAYLDKEFYTDIVAGSVSTKDGLAPELKVVTSRERSVLVTKLEEASFIAKKALSTQAQYQVPEAQ